MSQDDKYIVFKAKDVRWPEDDDINPGMHPAVAQVISDDVIGDAVVIRKQDVFAAPGLYAYANVIQTGLDLMELQEQIVGGILDRQLVERLEVIRDYFAEQAMDAGNHPRKKLPD